MDSSKIFALLDHVNLIYLNRGWIQYSSPNAIDQGDSVPICANNASYCETPAKIQCFEYSCEPLTIDKNSIDSSM